MKWNGKGLHWQAKLDMLRLEIISWLGRVGSCLTKVFRQFGNRLNTTGEKKGRARGHSLQIYMFSISVNNEFHSRTFVNWPWRFCSVSNTENWFQTLMAVLLLCCIAFFIVCCRRASRLRTETKHTRRMRLTSCAVLPGTLTSNGRITHAQLREPNSWRLET